MATFTDTVIEACRMQLDMTIRQIGILILCRRHVEDADKRRIGAIGTALLIPKAAVSRATDRLEKAGMVTRTVPQRDRRSCVVDITETGAMLLKTLVELEP